MTDIWCPYCRKKISGPAEQEHVFPESWYPDGTDSRVSRPKVPSCASCNRNYGKVEERLFRAWGLCVPSEAEASRGIPARAQRSIDPRAARSPRDAYFRSKTRASLRSKIEFIAQGERGAFPGLGPKAVRWGRKRSGVLVQGDHALAIETGDVKAFTEKLVLGLHYLSTSGLPVPTGLDILTFVVGTETWAELDGLIHKWNMDASLSVPPGFLVFRQSAVDDPTATIWFFTIWKTICLQAITVPPEV